MRVGLLVLLLVCSSILTVRGGGDTGNGNGNGNGNDTGNGNGNGFGELNFIIVDEDDESATLWSDPDALLSFNIFGETDRSAAVVRQEGENNPDIVCFARTATQAEFALFQAYGQLLNSSAVSDNPEMQAIIEAIYANKQKMVARNAALYILLTGDNVTVDKEELITLPEGEVSDEDAIAATNLAMVQLIERELDLAGVYNMGFVSTSNPVVQYVFYLGEHETIRSVSWLNLLSVHAASLGQEVPLPTPSNRWELACANGDDTTTTTTRRFIRVPQ